MLVVLAFAKLKWPEPSLFSWASSVIDPLTLIDASGPTWAATSAPLWISASVLAPLPPPSRWMLRISIVALAVFWPRACTSRLEVLGCSKPGAGIVPSNTPEVVPPTSAVPDSIVMPRAETARLLAVAVAWFREVMNSFTAWPGAETWAAACDELPTRTCVSASAVTSASADTPTPSIAPMDSASVLTSALLALVADRVTSPPAAMLPSTDTLVAPPTIAVGTLMLNAPSAPPEARPL